MTKPRAARRYFAYRSFWKETAARKRFEQLGADSTCFFISNTSNSLGEPYCQYPPVWLADGTYRPEGVFDFEPAERQIEDIIAATPNTRLICMVDLNTPLWLQRMFNLDSMTELGCLCSDSEWRRVTARFMKALLQHVEDRYGERIDAYVLSGGKTSEWYDHSDLRESKSRLEAWHRCLRAAGQPVAPIPDLGAREQVSFDGLLRDPEADGASLRYIRFCAAEIRAAIAFFLQEARTVIRPAVELGVFYGYPLVLGGNRVILGNNDCGELLDNPDLDFFIFPEGGFARTGMGSGDLGAVETIRRHGKSVMRECDQRTHTFNSQLAPHTHIAWVPSWKTEPETLAGVKRETGCTLIKRSSMWWFDMWGGFYDAPAVIETLGRCSDMYHRHIGDAVSEVAETALIVDPLSIYYLNQNDSGHIQPGTGIPNVAGQRTHWFYNQTKRMLDLLGAPWECYHFEDIPRIPNRDRIKFWLLPGIFELTPEKRAVLDRYVRRPGTLSFYLYAPGISDGRTLDPRRVQTLTGSAFGTPGVNVADASGHLSAYLASGDDMTPGMLRDLAVRAGVHLYLSEDVSVYANSRFLSIHVATAGTRRIALPCRSAEIRELYRDAVVARDCASFEYTFEAPDTALFSWGPACGLPAAPPA